MPDKKPDGGRFHKALPIDAALFVAMFFSTWGSGMQNLSSFDLSKIFPLLAAAIILYATLFVKNKVVFPRAFNWFVAFYLAHMVFTYAIAHPELLTFEHTEGVSHGADFVDVTEGPGITCVRVVLFIVFSYAFASLLWKRERLRAAALGYGAGLFVVLLVGGYTLAETSRAHEGELRNAGGFLDPNSLGFSGVAAASLALLAMVDAGKSRLLRAALVACLVVGGVAVLQSGSRTALMACLFGGVLIVTYLDKFSKKVNMAIAGVVIAATTLAFMPAALLDSLKDRVSISRAQADHGANRLDIWSNYADAWPSYAVGGVGFLLSRDVIRNNYTATLSMTHNQYFEVLVETGAVGFALFLAALWGLWNGVLARTRDARGRLLQPMLLAAMVGLLTEFMFLNLFYSRETWILFGAVAGLSYHWKDERA